MVAGLDSEFGKAGFVKLAKDGLETVWHLKENPAGGYVLAETLYTTELADGTKLFNGAPKEEGKFFAVGHIKEIKVNGKEIAQTGAVGQLEFLNRFK